MPKMDHSYALEFVCADVAWRTSNISRIIHNTFDIRSSGRSIVELAEVYVMLPSVGGDGLLSTVDWEFSDNIRCPDLTTTTTTTEETISKTTTAGASTYSERSSVVTEREFEMEDDEDDGEFRRRRRMAILDSDLDDWEFVEKHLNCGGMQCSIRKCELGPLISNESATITIKTRLNPSTMCGSVRK